MDRFVIGKRKDAEDSSGTPAASGSTDLNERPGEIPTTSSLATNIVKAEGDSSESRAPNVKRQPGRRYQESWKDTFHWLSYNEATEKAYCEFCRLAVNTMDVPVPDTSRDKDAHEAFVQVGFSGWQTALARFRNHENSNLHRAAVVAIACAKPGVNVHSKFSEGQQKHMQDARKALVTILSSVMYLACQDCELHSQDEEESKLKELLLLRAEDIPQMKTWLNRANDRWISPAMVNEMLEIMAHSVLCALAREVKAAEYYSVIVDGITEGQVSFCFRIATEDMLVEELCFGFYEAESTTVETCFSALKDVLCRFDLPLDRCRGQCYDGALDAGVHLSGLQALVKAEEPRALYVHHFAHVVNLVVQNVSQKVNMCRNFLCDLSDMITFVKTSGHHALLRHFQQTDNITLQQFCPTKWTVRAVFLQSVASNYEELIQFFENMASEERGDIGAKGDKYAENLLRFDFYFMLRLLLLVFDHLHSFNTALQEGKLLFRQTELLFASAKESTKQLRNNFQQLWSQTLMAAEDLDLESPTVPTRTKTRCSPEDFYRKIFDEVIDSINSSLHSCFLSDMFQHMSKIEKFVMREDDSTYILNFYKSDLDAGQLQLHRDMFLDIAKHRNIALLGLCDVIDLFSGEQGKSLRDLLPELGKLLRIVLAIPFNSCTSERSLSCRDRIKTILESSMRKPSLNHLALLYGYNQLAQEIDLDLVANEFIQRTSLRRKTFSVI